MVSPKIETPKGNGAISETAASPQFDGGILKVVIKDRVLDFMFTGIPFSLAALAFAAWIFRPAGYFQPVDFPREQVGSHMALDQQRRNFIVRVPGVTVDHQYWDQPFQITVDPAGYPVKVKLVPTTFPWPAVPPAMADLAIAQIGKRTFVPFLVKGAPAYARIVVDFTLVPEGDRPVVHIPFPRFANVEEVIMTYNERSQIRAPRSVTVHGDGSVDVIASDEYGHARRTHRTISKEKVLSLIDGFRQADFFSLENGYGGGPSEAIERVTSISIDGKTKEIREYEGQFGGLPDTVIDVEDALERTGGFAP